MRSVLAAAALAGAVFAAPHHETLTFTESEFVADTASPALPEERVRFSAALPWSNFELLEARLLDVSDPASPNYGEWMAQEEVNALTAPPAAARARASAFLAGAGAECVDMPHSLACTAPVSAVNALFSTTITAFAHTARGGKRVLRVHPNTPYAFPEGLRGSVEFVTNLVDFPTVRRKMGSAHSVKGAAVDYSITPETLVALYGTAKG
jgi:tripeptidyl-peptidase-1